MALTLVGLFVMGYLCGSIPVGLIIGKWLRGIDVREYGSGNIGFANVFRTVGAKGGALTFIGDVGKGAVPAAIAGVIIGDDTASVGSVLFDDQVAQVIAAMGAVIGHNWSVYLRFYGGKGVDTALGGMIAMSPYVGAACLVIGVMVILISRYVSVGSMVGAASSVVILAPLVGTDHEPVEYLIYGGVVTLLIVFRHRENIQRLRAGTERRLGQKGERKV